MRAEKERGRVQRRSAAGGLHGDCSTGTFQYSYGNSALDEPQKQPSKQCEWSQEVCSPCWPAWLERQARRWAACKEGPPGGARETHASTHIHKPRSLHLRYMVNCGQIHCMLWWARLWKNVKFIISINSFIVVLMTLLISRLYWNSSCFCIALSFCLRLEL